MTALIFDCDGVLADTERDGHLPAFNRMFEEFSLPVEWSLMYPFPPSAWIACPAIQVAFSAE